MKKLLKYVIPAMAAAALLTGSGSGKGFTGSREEAYTGDVTDVIPENAVESGKYLESCYEDVYVPGNTGRAATEEYGSFEEKSYRQVMSEPLSTFSADVDTASYSRLRRMIEDGYGLDDIPDNAVL